jgi:hypothetical protein
MVIKRFLVMEENTEILPITPRDAWGQTQDLSNLLATSDAGVQVSDELRTVSGAMLSLEAIACYLTKASEASELGQTGLQFANIAIESICLEANLSLSQSAFSLEAYQRSPTMAMEGALDFISAKIADIWKLIKEKLATFFRYLAEKMDFFKRNIGNLKRTVATLESQAGGIDSAAEALQATLYPQQCFADLLYLDTGFPQSGQGIAKAVDEVLLAHGKVFSTVINKHMTWLKDNHGRVSANPKVIEEFSVELDDFLMLDAAPLSRSIRKNIPKEGNVFYRSKELPGGKAIYTEIEPASNTGLAAIEMLANVNVYFDKFDPVSYDLKMLEMAQRAQADVNQWYWSLPVEQRKGQLPPQIDTSSAKLPGTGRSTRLTPGLVFDTLSLTQIKKMLKEVKASAEVIEQWYAEVFGQIWKDKDFDFLANTLLAKRDVKNYGTGLHLDPAPRYLGNLVLALLNVMGNATANTHAYAFTTYFSLLSYVEESLFQYPSTLKGK